MREVVVSIKETAPNCFRLTFDGAVLGDSRGYSKLKAEQVARSKNGQESGKWEGSEWVPFRYRCDL